MSHTPPDLSIIVPVYNEAANLEQLHRELTAALEGLGRSFEIIAVDDGSRDESFPVLSRLHAADPRLCVLRLLRNFGQNPALYAGFAHARGTIIVTIDADLQNPPSEIPKLIAKLDEGYDVVQGWREKRQDSPLRRVASGAINALMRRLARTEIRDLGTGLRAYRRAIVERMVQSSHHSRYVPAEIAWLGVRVGEVKVAHRERAAGESKYGLLALLRVNFDMIASISTAPVRLVAGTGLVLGLAGFLLGARVLYVRIIYGDALQLGTVLAAFFFLGGVQMLGLSVLCEYVSRIYVDVQQRPYYIVGEVLED